MSFPVTGYQDIAASAMGGNASQTAPTYQQAVGRLCVNWVQTNMVEIRWTETGLERKKITDGRWNVLLVVCLASIISVAC